MLSVQRRPISDEGWAGRKDEENESHAVVWRGLRFLRLCGWQETQSTQVIPWKLRGEEARTGIGARQAKSFRRRSARYETGANGRFI
jgi:hypothetical protein